MKEFIKGNLLLIDDEVLLLKGLEMHLHDLADKIFLADSGASALQILAEETVHCVLSDINMPKMNGIEVLKKIRAENNNVPFVFYTGHGNPELMLEAIKFGAFDFLNKPALTGIEEVLARGLKKGLGRESSEILDLKFMSEYQQLLSQLTKK